MNDRNALVEEIARLTQVHWINTNSPFLLSAMGPELKERGFDFQAIMRPLRLRQFVEYFLDDRLKVISDPNTPLKIGAVPKEALDSATPAELFSHTKTEVGVGEFYRLKPSIFSAFVKELPQGYKRYVDIKSKNYRYRDLPEEESVGSDFMPIERTKIVSDFDSTVTKKKILYANFEDWVENHGLKLGDFTFESADARRGHDIMSEILERLSNEELARISMPLDIVKKLGRT